MTCPHCGTPHDHGDEVRELGRKLAARILLADRNRKIVIPDEEEMIGIYLLERDDELPNRRRGK